MSATPEAGTQVGRNRLISELGEGGFGVVWLAQQKRPLDRQVALKLLKPGVDTRVVIRRFEAERQALALMSHPGIARVYDGGSTAQGRPFFAMELVDGAHINDYCRDARLSIDARLHLMIDVCRAVQSSVTHKRLEAVTTQDLLRCKVELATFADLEELALLATQRIRAVYPDGHVRHAMVAHLHGRVLLGLKREEEGLAAQ